MDNKLKFIDLFAGIGGFRVGFERAGFECVYSCEIDEHACQMYKENFEENPYGDITTLNPKEIPDFDILLAGFPCQAFSICGRQKGFYDDTRGTLFFDICKILEQKKPKAFVLENVKNLEKHDKGNTLTVMLYSLHELGYVVSYKVLNARDFGVPQNRERIIIVGSKEGYSFDFEKLEKKTINSMEGFLDKEGDFEYLKEDEYTLIEDKHIKQQKSGLIFVGYRNKNVRIAGVRPGTQHLSRVHKQPNRIYSAKGIHPTLASQETSGRYWIYVDGKVRKLTLNECFRFMGFPEDFKKIEPIGKLYQRIGNSICVKMVESVARGVREQFFTEGADVDMTDPIQFLENIYQEAVNMKDLSDVKLNERQLEWVNTIVEKEEILKGVFTVLFTSLVYKCLNPGQDVRLHQANMENGYSGRTFDTKYITPFLKSKHFYGAMKESGWLTRSLEQNLSYTLDYPGKISNKKVKSSFLNILNDIEENKENPRDYLKALIKESVLAKGKKVVVLINPIHSESKLSINDIMLYLHKHFYYKYKGRGASILPVLALYSIYECIVDELKRFEGKYLDKLASHTSCDRSSGATGDIVVRNKKDDSIYEVVEVKFDIPIDYIMIEDAYKKFASTPTQRYYILSTNSPRDDQYDKIQEVISKVRKEHGCQIIINGVFPTLKYYLRLLENTDVFLERYLYNLTNDSEVNYEQRLAWNIIINK
ncbi:DNA cytosine methyltransferase [Clostridium tetani]|uniref:DNA cytosine methyltransferase n=1 Tax=Clostridium tetani TaxID=1513 RepID=UPI001026EBC8|nr:DNA cytosine methyltransferase [Clostridium tetani]RXI73905.1 DNA cytosine methyltransferase [Clostridium tetani]BDR84447.1 hypothetical protein K254310026_18580 [Clostridium tetani]